MPTLRIDQAVEAAINDGADQLHIVPEADGCYLRFATRSQTTTWRRVSNQEGVALVAELKRLCDMPVRRDKELRGEGFVYAGGKRAILRARTAPYRTDHEKAIIEINAK